ncbi:ABC transporter permease [Prauserella shujinwangii]|nr:ABC transporter permease [Prauserella shujinwangii]
MTTTTTRDRPVRVERRHHLAGTWQLVRLALRRDRIVLPIWVLVLGLMASAGAGAYETLYPTQAERESLTAVMANNPSVSLIYGPAYDLSTAGGFTAWRYGTLVATFLALACIFTMTRHTRQEEDTGRHELLASAVVGRYAALTASVIVAGLGSLATGLLITVSLMGAGLPAAGSVAFGASTALVGFVFIGIAAIAVQLAEYSRTANGIASAVLGAAFIVRAVGDASADGSWLSWLSPIGWATRVRAFADERWWVLALLVAAAVVLTGAGYFLLPKRDVGMSLIPARPGPAAAAPGLRSPFALAWRLHRGALIGWTVGFALMGAMYGSLAAGIGDIIGDSEQSRQMFERLGGADALVDAFIGMTALMVAMIASLYAVQSTLRMRAEESAVRVEPLLATRVSRLGWAASHLVFPLLGTALLLAVAGFCTGLLHGLRVGDVGGQLPSVLGATMAQLPAVWVVAGLAVALFGFLPKAATAAWAVAAAFVLLSMFGPILQLNQAVLNVSPFQHVPNLPAAEFTATPLVWLTVLAVAFTGAGLAAFRRRDIG